MADIKAASDEDDDLPEYAPGELRRLLKGAVRGKYYDPNRKLMHVVALDPDVYAAFPNDKAVNDALRGLMTKRGQPSQK